jgi:hypothetical protein
MYCVFDNGVLRKIFGPKVKEKTNDEKRVIRNCMILLIKYYLCDHVKKCMMSCASDTYGGQGKYMQNSDGGT